MKSILLSIKPEWLAKILNGEKTIEVRKKFPKDYVGWVYLYCSKSKPYLLNKLTRDVCFWEEKQITADDMLNGKVVARFWCDEVYIYDIENRYTFFDSEFNKTCEKLMGICSPKLYEYVGNKIFYGIHISKLEIFDRPREISEFRSYKVYNETDDADYDIHLPITKAPQNYCYVEGEPR